MQDLTTVLQMPWHSCSLLLTQDSIHQVYTFLNGRGRLKLNQGDGAPLNPFRLSQTFLSQTSGSEAHAPFSSCSVIVFLLSASSL